MKLKAIIISFLFTFPVQADPRYLELIREDKAIKVYQRGYQFSIERRLPLEVHVEQADMEYVYIDVDRVHVYVNWFPETKSGDTIRSNYRSNGKQQWLEYNYQDVSSYKGVQNCPTGR